MNDILPHQTRAWQKLERVLEAVFRAYAYHEIRVPLLERTELFARSIGDETDIVGKEMYTFTDRSGDSLTLRPEATASCLRAGLQHGLFHNQQQRLWYRGPMFRYERPQRGRYRQFHQAGAEALGWEGPDIDAELIALSRRLWQELAIPMPELQLNSLGSPACRAVYREKLVAYLERFAGDLDVDSQRRLSTNPLRILDSKIERTQEILGGAPTLVDHIDKESRAHFDDLCLILDQMGIPFRLNPGLVRGLDYYTRTVFEWVSSDLGAQSAVCAGGRYDGLVELLGGRPTPGIGFAMGLERLVEISSLADESQQPDLYVAALDESVKSRGLLFSENLRDHSYNVEFHCGAGSLKSQIRKADKSGATLVAMIGDKEAKENLVTIKHLRAEVEQRSVPAGEAVSYVTELLKQEKAIL